MNQTSDYTFYVGVDWASMAHQVTVLDRERQPVGERTVAHTAAALGALGEWLTQLAGGEPAQVAVAIEVPRGAIVETLLERGFPVFAINPKQLDRFRDRHSVAGAKDDRRDAFVLADSLATDRHCFRRLAIDAPEVIQLRELSRVSEDLQGEHQRLTNRLRDQLHRVRPELLALCPAADEAWFWALLTQAPTPAAGAQLRRAAVAALLRTHRLRRLTADDVVARLQAPALRVAPGTVEAVATHISLLLPRLQLLAQQLRACARQLDQLLARLAQAPDDAPRQHRDVTILRSLPGVGRIVAATMLAEAGQPLAARDYHALRAQVGAAPVTKASGKRRLVQMRHACNRRLRNAVYHWARVSSIRDAHSRQHYARLRARGHSHGRALRTLADRLLALLVAMLRTATLYDPGRRRPVTAAA